MNDFEFHSQQTETPRQQAESYIFRILSGNLEKGELPPGFNGFLPLPLTEPVMATGYIHCPAGVAITNERIWVAHLAFMDEEDVEALWPNWSELEDKLPQHVYALGQNMKRVDLLSRALRSKTGVRTVESEVITPKYAGLFNLRLQQEESLLTIAFEESRLPSNNIQFHTEVKPKNG